ncbi:MAG: hypothetical protein ABI988_18595 [Nitrospirota bacterium]
MPNVFGTNLSALALDKMEDYLAEVDEGKEQRLPNSNLILPSG